MTIDFEVLRDWFVLEKRDFPWRNSPTPYQVWISEIMLQQTQTSVVIRYYEKWMERFPSIAALAGASEEQVLKVWEGLGYYSRARHLHRAAQELIQNQMGHLPQSEEKLLKIKGIGPYTAAAILSFAFHQKAAAVDGNVARVLARLFCIEEDITKGSTQKVLRETLLRLLPDQEPWVIMEALIELGATVCMKRPACDHCPVQQNCLGFKNEKAESLPYRGKKSAVISLFRFVPVIQHQGFYLVQKGKQGKVMAGLYEFPYLEEKKKASILELEEKFKLKLSFHKKLDGVKHTFTCHRARLYPSLYSALKPAEVEGYEWLSIEKLRQLPFSSGHKRILLQVIK
ncbi:MAG TPA: A/G-specific adenine glycosylase [Rhabdochlamydiaceae bacterium]|nr:A/G-specific adenine glycosylase [Rhabdochlamydiaceae bacterium]